MYGWKKVGIVKPTVDSNRLSLHPLKSLLKENGIQITVEIDIDPHMTPDEIAATGNLKLLKNKARIILVELGLDLHHANAFMLAAHRAEMKSIDYLYMQDFPDWRLISVELSLFVG